MNQNRNTAKVESTFICWHQLLWFLQNVLIHGCLKFVVSNTTDNNQWEILFRWIFILWCK